MEQYIIRGGTALNGEVEIGGAKNAALGILAAAIMTDEEVLIENLPDVRDVNVMLEAMIQIGVKVDRRDRHSVVLCGADIGDVNIEYEYIKKIRASYYLLGALLGKYKKAEVPLPGGCNIGSRPIDLHLKGFKALGAKVTIQNGSICAVAQALKGRHIFLDTVSVGATINIMMAASMAEGRTVIENCAKEPHVVDVANFLNSMGANIKGAGTDVIRIVGVEKLHSTEYSIIPDQIEAGTYMIAAAVTNGDVTIHNLIPTHMEPLSAKMREMGYQIEEGDESIRVFRYDYEEEVYPTSVKTSPYPGFPTDLQPQTVVLLCSADGQSRMHENVWQNRFQYVPELAKMGANINVYERIAWVNGKTKFRGATVEATDLRAGAALVCAALEADGTTYIMNAQRIDRGYEHIVQKLTELGAVISRVNHTPEYGEEDTEA